MSTDISISRCTVAQRADALRVLHAGLPTDLQMGLVHALQAARELDDSIFDGLLVAVSADELIGAAWAQLTAGSTAVVWPPAVDSAAAAELMSAMSNFIDANNVVLAQLLLSDDQSIDNDLLQVAGFQRLARLAYLTIDQPACPAEQPTSQLTFAANAGSQPEALGELLQRTYEGSCDCPQLNGVRDMADVVAGYREQGVYAAERWFTVTLDGSDVGALILTAYEDSGNWELVYMGLFPEARGQGLGRQILEFAKWQARTAGAPRLVLAVDDQNSYAMTMYQRAGFTKWDERTVFARLRPR